MLMLSMDTGIQHVNKHSSITAHLFPPTITHNINKHTPIMQHRHKNSFTWRTLPSSFPLAAWGLANSSFIRCRKFSLRKS